MTSRPARDANLARAFIRNCHRQWNVPKVADSTGKELSGGKLLIGTLVFRRLLRRAVLAGDERFVGVLVPPSVGGILANTALTLDRRVAVNLNYTVSSDVMNACIRQCGIRHVLTSRRVMDRFHFDLDAELVYLEDLLPQVTSADKAIAAAMAYAMPASLLERWLGVDRIGADDLLTVLFTSGSTGEPKGVMLSFGNVAANVYSIEEMVQMSATDVALGVLPFFHSYGYTATMWTALVLPPKAAYHFSPLEARQVGELARKHRATIVMATPTFLRSYIKRCQTEDFAHADMVVASAEKLPVEVSDAFEQRFGVRPVEAFGATELSPLACLNLPPSRYNGPGEGNREGTVGRPIPGVRVRITDPETGEVLPQGEPGMLCVTGDNVMQGYLNRPDLTADVIHNGWYVTGDIARVDEEGFVEITGRLSRFSKIGGEMVPHIRIEEAIGRLLVREEHEEQIRAVVTAVPDPKKGERIVVLHTEIDQSPDEICRELARQGLPNLWIPAPDSFCQIDEVPVLGTGKLDLRALKELALERFGLTASA